jgi:hypothetical protein
MTLPNPLGRWYWATRGDFRSDRQVYMQRFLAKVSAARPVLVGLLFGRTNQFRPSLAQAASLIPRVDEPKGDSNGPRTLRLSRIMSR